MLTDDIYFEDFLDANDIVAQIMADRANDAKAIRSIEAVECIYNCRGLLAAPVAAVYRIEFTDSSNKEILVMGNGNQLDFENARILERGRSSDQLGEVLKLIIRGQEGTVSADVKEYLYAYEMNREQMNNQRYYNS